MIMNQVQLHFPSFHLLAALYLLLDHWDLAIYLTGLDLFSDQGAFNTLGLAHTGGMCSGRFSCLLTEFGTMKKEESQYPSTGLGASFVLAHEIGHSLGMRHDDHQGRCQKVKDIICSLYSRFTYLPNLVRIDYCQKQVNEPLLRFSKATYFSCHVKVSQIFYKSRVASCPALCQDYFAELMIQVGMLHTS